MKKRKVLLFVLLVFFIAAAGIGAYFACSQKIKAAESSQEIVLEEGQELLYAKIMSISGNEMVYALLEEQTVDFTEPENAKGRSGMPSGKKMSADENPSNGENPLNGENSLNGENLLNGENSLNGENPLNGESPSDSGKMPNGVQFSDGESLNGKMPSGDERPTGDASSNNRNKRTPDNVPPEDMQNKSMTTYTETGKTGQIQIPVGTDVETKLGTITTFSRLSNGDTIRMLLQKVDNGGEELLKIWIVE